MTDQTYPLTYVGRQARGRVALPGRHVRYSRGETVEFTADEAARLDAEDWAGDRPVQLDHVGDALADGGGSERTGTTVPAGETGILIADSDGPDLALATGVPLGTIAEVLPLATTAERARALLDVEVSTKNRPTLVAQLAELAGADPTDQADTADNQEA